MMQYFKDILTTFSMAQRIWALIILCIAVFLITFGSNIIDAIKPDPTQQGLIIVRQKKQITFLNKQLDSSSITIDSLTEKVLDGQSECSRKRFQTQQEMNREIDSLIGLMTPRKIKKHRTPRVSGPPQDSCVVARDEVVEVKKVEKDDRVNVMISGLKHLKNKLNK
jgi:hypothetical protein